MVNTRTNTLSGSITHKNTFQDFKAGLDELEENFPMVVQELVCTAKIVLRSSREQRYDNTNAGDKHQEDRSAKEGRKPAEKTTTKVEHLIINWK